MWENGEWIAVEWRTKVVELTMTWTACETEVICIAVSDVNEVPTNVLQEENERKTSVIVS